MAYAKSTPEQVVKNHILMWLRQQRSFSKKRCFTHPVKNMGVYDAKLGRYRKDTSAFAMKGIPDIMGIWRGRPLAIEVKAPERRELFQKFAKGRPSAEQIEYIKNFVEAGGIAFVAWGVEDVKRELAAADKGEKYVWEREAA